MKSDVIVIGSGMAGLIAAAAAAQRGKKTTLLSKGAGTLVIGGGIVDILGYTEAGKAILSPGAAVEQAQEAHPYAKLGLENVKQAAKFLQEICEQEGYAYVGDLEHNQWVPTAAGTLKPTCLVPRTMDASRLCEAEEIVVVGLKGLKDYPTELISKGLERLFGANAKVTQVEIALSVEDGRDVTALDMARWLDSKAGLEECAVKLRQVVKSGATLIMPPVLGTKPSYYAFETLQEATGCHIIETSSMPPAVTGLRLRKALLAYAKRQGVTIVDNAEAVRADVKNGRCTAIYTQGFGREHGYEAAQVIVATGGLYGGGLVAEPNVVQERIFGLPVGAPEQSEFWGIQELFSPGGQPFAKFGVAVDDTLRPVDAAGTVLLENVRFAGRNLAGYDFSYEKSGNGVALASGYCAGMTV
ncbi:anaerobic glycerol-3-phosphate dehydrogenase subunit GlpB [Anaeromusa sp.]|uniref:anaerobic glycerol-3-phosphate dehydrogenase subunit GlpB n=1 Tax=Anaeromusa sp. TaxID=1872520 RepID=UPI002628FEF4|nr:anaerobic glycerol-3-phosphate dehydrogenase subunit GlpB [Anaeromusa sp.]MDD3157725.1 anaerobic glycerol-3-phosphate dehydrogenase subunit GlpB [Anaeromusa sp.]